MRRAFLGLAAALLAAAPSFAVETVQPSVPSVAPLASVDLALTPPRLEALRGILTAAPAGLPARAFESYVELQPAAMARTMAEQKQGFQKAVSAMTAMYNGLARVARPVREPGDERAALTMILARRYADYLQALIREPDLAAPTRQVAARMRDRLEDGSAARGLLLASRVQRRAKLLSEAAGAAAATPSGGAWRIPAPVPASERTRKAGLARVFTVSLPKLAEAVEAQRETLSRGLDAAEREALAERAQYERKKAQRVGDISIRKTLLKGKTHKISRIPSNQDLRLIPKRGGFVLKARFKSSIADRRVWKVVKDSIEKEWRGRFVYAGKTYFLRTEVSIEPLAAGEEPGEDFLILREGQDAASHASEQGITLTRDFDYLTPAHEFGHVVGLPDEYTETYDFDAMTVRHVAPLASLMANSHVKAGIIRPRHLKLAYQLLRRRRLVRPDPSTR